MDDMPSVRVSLSYKNKQSASLTMTTYRDLYWMAPNRPKITMTTCKKLTMMGAHWYPRKSSTCLSRAVIYRGHEAAQPQCDVHACVHVREGERDCESIARPRSHMASMQDGLHITAPPYGKVLLLGVIAAASAFVVTILIVVLCVGCQRKGKTHNAPGESGKHRLMDMGILKQSKLRSISKSEPSEMSKVNCNGKSRQLPQIPSGTGEDGEHTYSEVGRGASTARTDDALYAMVGRAGQTDTPAPPAVPANTPAPPDPDGDVEAGLPESESQVVSPPETAEYAVVRKLRKADKAPQKRDSGTDMAEPPAPPTRHGPPSHPAPPPPHPHSAKLPRRNIETFNVPSFPKEVMFMGNGEQYIWKPPEEDEIMMLQNKALGPLAHTVENIQPSAAAVAEMYSKVCKPGKKKRSISPPGNVGFRTLGRGTGTGMGALV
uniref:Si:dkey-70p6.1 n=1 Tax=Neogobius melanostomus TaxID=47308 RepID=A0A8C6T258_9GOBI